MQKSVVNIVLLSWEPLGVFLYVLIEEEGGVMVCHLDAVLCLGSVCALSTYLPEVGLAEPAH